MVLRKRAPMYRAPGTRGKTHTPLGRHPTGQTPPWADTPPKQTPPAQCILGYTLPCPVHAGIHPPMDTMGYGQKAGGMHPNGMHSC